jgi:3-phenylpropionate/trans-cinnamate dioxygenase ferredoxin subunit
MPHWIRVCTTAELLPGEFQVAWDDGTAILVCNVDGALYALEDRCSHQDFELSAGELAGNEITCSLHGARFDVRTGKALCAPAYSPVRAFPVKIEDGVIYTRDDRA